LVRNLPYSLALFVFVAQAQWLAFDAQTRPVESKTRSTEPQTHAAEVRAQNNAQHIKNTLTVKSVPGGFYFTFGTKLDLGVLQVFNLQDKLVGRPLRLNRPQSVFVKNGYGVTLVVGEDLKKNPSLLKLFPADVITGLDLNGIESPTRTNAKEILRHAGQFKNLKKLYLWGCDITDSDIDLISRYDKLDTLAISYTKLTGKSVCNLSSLPHWKFLDANRVDGIGFVIDKLPQAKNIADLRISSKELTEKDFENISKLSNIEFLEISKASMNESSVKLLAKLKKLRYLVVRYCHFEGKSIEGLAKLKALKVLFISRNMVYSYPFLGSSYGKSRSWTLSF
jgi:hypothetical protein